VISAERCSSNTRQTYPARASRRPVSSSFTQTGRARPLAGCSQGAVASRKRRGCGVGGL
jgi:hypothetical protein